VELGRWNNEFDGFFAFIQEQLEDRRKPDHLWSRRFSTTPTHPSSGLFKYGSGDGSDDQKLKLSSWISRLCSPFRSDKFGFIGRKTEIAATSDTSVGSSSEVNSLVSIKSTKGSAVEELDEIMENLDLHESSGYSDMGSDKNLDKSINYSEEDFMACYGNVSANSEDTWRSGLSSSHYASNQHQVNVIIRKTSDACKMHT
jgi:hypothetical protein